MRGSQRWARAAATGLEGRSNSVRRRAGIHSAVRARYQCGGGIQEAAPERTAWAILRAAGLTPSSPEFCISWQYAVKADQLGGSAAAGMPKSAAMVRLSW